MADSSIIQPTTFPRLSDLLSPIQHEDIDETRYKQRKFSFATNYVPCPKGREALLKSYSQFVATYTGESEVTFQYALRTALYHAFEPQVIQAKAFTGEISSEHEQPHDYMFDIIQHEEEDTTNFDFGLEIIADVDSFSSAEAPALLSCPFVVQYHAMEMTLTMRYDTLLMDEEYAGAAFKMLVNHISRTQIYSDQETRLSILNHPPLQQRPLHNSGADFLLLHSTFQKTVNEHPGRHALDYRSETTQFTMTYRQLDAVTTSLAHKLRNSIPQPSQNGQIIVPVYMKASPALYISWLAVLKAGYAFCPLPVDAPALELQSIVEDTCASVVLTNGPMLCGCPWDAWYCDDDDLSAYLDVNEFITAWMQTPHIQDDKLLPSIADTDLAYVMYSSASSAMPVGAKMTHRAASSMVASYSKQIPSYMTKKGFRWLASSSPVSHISCLEIFATWCTGGTLCAVGPTLNLNTAIDKVSATITTTTFSQASTLDLARVPSLRHLWCEGSLPTSLIQQLEDVSRTAYSPLRVLKLYTASNDNILTGIVSNTSSSTRGSLIGSPLSGTNNLLLHPKTRSSVPLGAVGDLFISGSGLPSGFLNRPDLDATVFFLHPVYGRLLKTGDRGRLVKNGRGEFVVDLAKGNTGAEAKEVQSCVSGRNSVASMVDSFTEACELESEEKIDIAEANVLSLIGKIFV
ncbi:acetyl-CoA synthetase-like protein [Aureobasidium sp. EXF-3400]|nr:acetyl-CoA synthetase-like protein [Aureobasidium sp. EXF-12344]KAI4778366.1 acetyl-CoA synthetase-like protein [Aureobasidium sp. EXF-3400]